MWFKTGKTPVIEGTESRKLLATIPATTLCDLRDRAPIATALAGRSDRARKEQAAHSPASFS